MDRRMGIFLSATVVSVVCSVTLLATTATRVTTPVYIAWLTTSLALFYIGLCFVATMYLRGQTLTPDAARTGLGDENAENENLRTNVAVDAGIEDPPNTSSLSTFYWCSPGLQNNTASVSASRTPETVIHKSLQSSSGLLSATMQSSPMPPGLPPAAYFDSSAADLQTALQLRVLPGLAKQVTPPLPAHQSR